MVTGSISPRFTKLPSPLIKDVECALRVRSESGSFEEYPVSATLCFIVMNIHLNQPHDIGKVSLPAIMDCSSCVRSSPSVTPSREYTHTPALSIVSWDRGLQSYRFGPLYDVHFVIRDQKDEACATGRTDTPHRRREPYLLVRRLFVEDICAVFLAERQSHNSGLQLSHMIVSQYIKNRKVRCRHSEIAIKNITVCHYNAFSHGKPLTWYSISHPFSGVPSSSITPSR